MDTWLPCPSGATQCVAQRCMSELWNKWWTDEAAHAAGYTHVVEIWFDGPTVYKQRAPSRKSLAALVLSEPRPTPESIAKVDVRLNPFVMVVYIDEAHAQRGGHVLHGGRQVPLGTDSRLQDPTWRGLAEDARNRRKLFVPWPQGGAGSHTRLCGDAKGMSPRMQHTEVVRIRDNPDNGEQGIELHAVRCGNCEALNVFDELRYDPGTLPVRRIEESILDSDTHLVNHRVWWEVEGEVYTDEMAAVRAAEAVFSMRLKGVH